MLDMIMNKKKECDFEDSRQYEALSVRNGLGKRVWLHRYYVGKFGREEHVRVYDTEKAAMAQYAVLGGTVVVLFETGSI